MRELDATGHVADRVDVRDVRLQGVVRHLDAAPVELDADPLQVHALDVRLAAHAEQDHVDLDGFDLVARLDGDPPALARALGLLHRGAGLDLDALAGEDLAELDAEVRVEAGHREQAVLQLDEGDLRAHAVEHVGELAAHRAAAQDRDPLGDERHGHRVVARPDVLHPSALQAGHGDVDHAGAHREDEVLRL